MARSKAGNDFDLQALFAALDAKREACEMSWAEATRAINRLDTKGKNAPPRAIATSTILGLRDSKAGAYHQRGEECDTVLAELRWLGRSPESFVPGFVGANEDRYQLPDKQDVFIYRLQTAALYSVLQDTRTQKGLTWQQTATEIGGFSPAALMNLARGGRSGIRRIVRICNWLERPVAEFVKPG